MEIPENFTPNTHLTWKITLYELNPQGKSILFTVMVSTAVWNKILVKLGSSSPNFRGES